jgi:hypothetical protein
MSVIRDILRQYWTHILALGVFTCAAVRYWRLDNYLEENHLTGIVCALGGLLLVLNGDEWTASPSDDSERLTPDPDWIRRRSYTYRSWGGPIFGGIVLIWGTITLYRL